MPLEPRYPHRGGSLYCLSLALSFWPFSMTMIRFLSPYTGSGLRLKVSGCGSGLRFEGVWVVVKGCGLRVYGLWLRVEEVGEFRVEEVEVVGEFRVEEVVQGVPSSMRLIVGQNLLARSGSMGYAALLRVEG